MERKTIELLNNEECPNCGHSKKNTQKAKKFALNHIREYCSAASIHGVQYLGESERPLSEKLWWVTVFFISFLGNSYLIRQIWIKWNESPVIVSFSETTTPVWEIPFPTVTLCPLTAYRNTDFHFLKPLYNITAYPEYREDIEALSLMCSNPAVNVDGNLTTNKDLIEFYKQIRIPFLESLVAIEWGEESTGDQSLFSEILTSDGICYSFNILDYTELYRAQSWPPLRDHSRSKKGWTIEEGYFEDEKNSYPERTVDAGIYAGLQITMLGLKQEFDHWCHGFTPGFKIVLSSPGEIPNVREKYFIAEPDKQVFVGVNPDIIQTSETLKSYKPSLRKCYFPSERYLSHFKLYSQKNCELECLTNYTMEECQCIEFYMPRHNGSDVPICGPGSRDCVYEVKRSVRLLEKVKNVEGTACDCLPSCSSTTYKLDVTQHKLEWQTLIELGIFNDVEESVEGVTLSKISVYYTDKQYTSSQRSELYGLVDFLANCGGLIGLFSGFSVLSIVEIIYFLTLRCWNNMKKI